MRIFNTFLVIALLAITTVKTNAQGEYKAKFEQLGTDLATPNKYRTGAGSPGVEYWQQQANYEIKVEVDDQTQVLSGAEKITYFNNSPDKLKYLWVQLDQNVRAKGSLVARSDQNVISDSIAAKWLPAMVETQEYEGGYKIKSVTDGGGKPLPHTIEGTMMRVDLPQVLSKGENFVFNIEWSYQVYDRMEIDGRGGYEYFPKDDNYAYTIAQWFPRMAAYTDFEGWQNKQFMGRGEFALTFGNYKVDITVPSDHIVGATGVLQNENEVLTEKQRQRLEKAKSSSSPVMIVTQREAVKKEKAKAADKSTWSFHAENVRDFAFTSSRKYIWDAMGVDINGKMVMAMSYYTKEGNPLWEKESTKAVARTLETYSRYTFDYPYPVAISVHAANQGMEYPMICFNYGRPNPDGSYSQSTLEGMVGVIVHEVGHNFFPMIVNSDERQWTWMDEGLNSFMEHVTLKEWYPDFDLTWGTPEGIVPYMMGDKQYIRPIMTNSEQVLQFGYNAYGKPSAALLVLRDAVMGKELFDYAFKEYARKWAFKHPTPADFFRTMEDASAVDLDWFWKGWFYTTDHVDVSVDEVKWYRIKNSEPGFENRVNETTISGNNTITEGFEEFTVIDTDARFYREFMNRVDDDQIRANHTNKNFYQVKLTNSGGLVTPIFIEWTYTDGTKEVEKIPAEIWRLNENEVTKVFLKEKEVASMKLDPMGLTADVDEENNSFPRQNNASRFEQFKKKSQN